MSDAASPNHATLPRRSNSPLPHERDMMDRDRYSLNRSGLQVCNYGIKTGHSCARLAIVKVPYNLIEKRVIRLYDSTNIN